MCMTREAQSGVRRRRWRCRGPDSRCGNSVIVSHCRMAGGRQRFQGFCRLTHYGHRIRCSRNRIHALAASMARSRIRCRPQRAKPTFFHPHGVRVGARTACPGSNWPGVQGEGEGSVGVGRQTFVEDGPGALRPEVGPFRNTGSRVPRKGRPCSP